MYSRGSIKPKSTNIDKEVIKVGFTLKALRVNAGLTQDEAAQVLEITPETLGRWENAKSFPTVPQITKIEQLYKTKYADIIFLPKNIGLTEE